MFGYSGKTKNTQRLSALPRASVRPLIKACYRKRRHKNDDAHLKSTYPCLLSGLVYIYKKFTKIITLTAKARQKYFDNLQYMCYNKLDYDYA